MKLKKQIPLLLAAACTVSSFFINAQGYLSIVTSSGETKIDSGYVHVQTSNGVEKVPVDGFVVSNGTTNNVINGDSNDNGNNKDESLEVINVGYVNTQSGLNVRSGPSSSYTILGALNYKETVEILATENGWHKIKYKDVIGYVSASYVTITGGSTNTPDDSNNESTAKTGYVNTQTGVNVRKGPSTSYDVLGALSYKQTVTIVSTENGWHKIEYGSGYGYVSASYITIGDVGGSGSGKIKKIVIDAGHGGSDPGAIGPTGLQEKDVALNVSLKLRDILRNNGLSVVMTRTTDIYLTLQERTKISNASGADFFLSVHANSFTSPTSNGTETYSYSSTGMGAEVAKLIQTHLINAINLTNRGFKTANYYVLKYNNLPSALVELAFISNPEEESLLAQDAFQNKCAKAIADAILSY